jgi:hypothetical protein
MGIERSLQNENVNPSANLRFPGPTINFNPEHENRVNALELVKRHSQSPSTDAELSFGKEPNQSWSHQIFLTCERVGAHFNWK